MKTKKRPIWMKIGSFWPPNLRRWINFLKVCVNYSVSWYTYKDILFNHHPYPESWESIPYIHGNYTHKNNTTYGLGLDILPLKLYWVFISFFQFTAARWCLFMMPSLELWTRTKKQFSFDTKNIFVSKVSHCITHYLLPVPLSRRFLQLDMTVLRSINNKKPSLIVLSGCDFLDVCLETKWW